MKFDPNFLDKNGLVLPQPKVEDKPADNGVLFTSVAVLLGFDFSNYIQLIEECYLDTGLLARWKGNNFDQSQWDDYLAVAVCCAKIGNKRIPRQILWYGLKHLFFYDTDGKLEGKDFLLRNFPIWPIMLVAAFPLLKYVMFPILWLTQLFFKDIVTLSKQNDTSGLQLQWLFLLGCANMGFVFKKFKEHQMILPYAFAIYYHKDHPFNGVLP